MPDLKNRLLKGTVNHCLAPEDTVTLWVRNAAGSPTEDTATVVALGDTFPQRDIVVDLEGKTYDVDDIVAFDPACDPCPEYTDTDPSEDEGDVATADWALVSDPDVVTTTTTIEPTTTTE